MFKTACIIVTFNKLSLFKECLQSVMNQSKKVDLILVVDNHSNDGTEEFMESIISNENNIKYFRLSKNIGGAGGFNYGLKKAYEENIDFIWIMDDDTVPYSDALEHLMPYAENTNLNWGFLSSNVRWIDGTPCLMNIPDVNLRWNDKADEGLIRINSASFVSLLIKKQALDEVGYPIKDFFIWNDDVEFTLRLSQNHEGFFIPTSKVMHKMAKNNLVDIIKDDRIGRYFFGIRNSLFTSKIQGKKSFVKCLLQQFVMIGKVLFIKNEFKFKKVRVILRGIGAGLTFNPSIEHTNKS